MTSQSNATAPSGRSLSDAALSAFVRSLAPLQALSGGLRALPISPDRVQSSPVADSGAPSEASDRGTLARARLLSARLSRVGVADRVTLEWLVTYAHADAHPDTLSDLIARTSAFGLIDTRDAVRACLDSAIRRRQQIEVEASHARQRLRHGAALSTDATITARLSQARALEETFRARHDEALAALRRYGRERIERAALAWEEARNT